MVIYNALPRKEYERIFMCNTAKEIWKTLLITHQGNSQVKNNKIDLLVQQYEQFVISKDEFIDIAFARFNTIITSLKALDEGYSGKNYVRKFLRPLNPKWRANVTTIEESKDLTSLSIDELIGNLKVHEMIIKKDSEIVKAKVKRKSLTLKTKKESRSSLREEVDSYGDPNHLIGECPKPPKDKNQRAFVRGSWSHSGEEDDEKLKEEALKLTKFEKSTHCLNEMLNNQKPFGEKLGLRFNSFEASSSRTKEIKFVKAQKKVSPDGGPINMGGPFNVQAAPKANMGLPPGTTPGSEKSVSFQKSILGPIPKHIIVNNVRVPVASDNEVKQFYKPLSKPGVGFSNLNFRSKTPPPKRVINNYRRPKTSQPKRNIGLQNQPRGFPICIGVDLEPDEWIKDSRCSKHMKGNRKLFSSYKVYNRGNVIFGSNLRGNLIGKGLICDNKCRVTFSEHDSEITKNGKVMGRGDVPKAET
ncbi:hypothetical protein Tco_0285459 [Tanacetum coccineum]